jgi:hypothetical protein
VVLYCGQCEGLGEFITQQQLDRATSVVGDWGLQHVRRELGAALSGLAGVFAVQTSRQRQFGLADNTWRSARDLHAFGLVDRSLDSHCDPANGKISDFGALWKKHEVMPTTFTIVDAALERPAVTAIDQILVALGAARTFDRVGLWTSSGPGGTGSTADWRAATSGSARTATPGTYGPDRATLTVLRSTTTSTGSTRPGPW